MNKVILSIITVCFNSRNTIGKTFNNIRHLKKSYSFQYIVIDGNSTDGTIEIIQNNGDIIDFFISEKDNGIYDAMNKGVKISTGRYISFLNSDDLYSLKNFKYFYEGLLDGKYDYIHGNLVKVFKDRQEIIRPDLNSKNPLQPSLTQPTSFLKKDIYDAIGLFNTSFKVSGDTDFLIRMLKYEKFKGLYLNKEITYFSTEGVSKNPFNIKEHVLLCKNNNFSTSLLVWFYIKLSLKRFIKRLLRLIS